MTKAIIIDDENKACQVLQSLILELDKDIEIIDMVTDPKEAKNLIESSNPDIIFLDIEMPFLNGFDVLQSLNSLHYEIIFVTGHDEFAINAFKFSATGYILKPINIDELETAINFAIERIKQKKSSEHNRILIQNLATNQDKKLGVPTMDGIDFISINQIIRCEGVVKCTKVISKDRAPIISSYNLGEFTKLLSMYGFYTAHKSHLINLNFITKYYKDGTITMADGSTIPLARRRKQEFLSVITKVS